MPKDSDGPKAHGWKEPIKRDGAKSKLPTKGLNNVGNSKPLTGKRDKSSY